MLKETSRTGTYAEYDIYDREKVGTIQTVEEDGEIFIRQVSVGRQFLRRGYATKAVREIIGKGKETRLCVSGHSKSAAAFWPAFFEEIKKDGYLTENVKGATWRIWKHNPPRPEQDA